MTGGYCARTRPDVPGQRIEAKVAWSVGIAPSDIAVSNVCSGYALPILRSNGGFEMTSKSTAEINAVVATNASGSLQSKVRQLTGARHAIAIGQITGIMIRSPQHRFAFLADLEWLVLPALGSDQFAIHETFDRASGHKMPAACVLWATVSHEVDARLCATPTFRPRLKPEEWTSGPIPWLMDAAGYPHLTELLVKTLVYQRFRATGIKTYSRGKDGKPIAGILRATGIAELARASEATIG